MTTGERETVSLIGSDKVEGTSVYGANDTQIGSIERVMIDKRSRQGLVRGSELWWLSWYRRRSLSYPRGELAQMTPIWVVTAAASPNSSCKVRQSTATTTNGVGKIRPARGRLTLLRGHPYLNRHSRKARLEGGLCTVETENAPRNAAGNPGPSQRVTI